MRKKKTLLNYINEYLKKWRGIIFMDGTSYIMKKSIAPHISNQNDVPTKS